MACVKTKGTTKGKFKACCEKGIETTDGQHYFGYLHDRTTGLDSPPLCDCWKNK